MKKIKRYASFLATLLTFSLGSISLSHAVSVSDFPVLQKLVKQMSEEDGYPAKELIDVLSRAKIDQKTLELMDRQYESLPWHKYRKLFINDRRINDGVEFWEKNTAILDQVTEKFGVPQQILVALLGVETHYGKRIGDKSVLNSLVTLSAAFPRRSKYFTKELRVFLKTTREEKIDPSTVLGSFAGAIGIPQFMPSSYRAYSIDFNGNGRRDLVNEYEDAIGSVANYLHVHGWTRGQAIYADVSNSLPEEAKELVTRRAKPKLSSAQLIGSGVNYDNRGGSNKAALLKLKESDRNRYIVGFRNLYAITRYNPSVNYAMAIVELSQEISERR
ncbi:MAG: lytic murein transglycosylase B [Gammaproteobacteria bacterium]|nr:lytic murein transglycosylase B [Gammaproteobacteria bacterium]NKB65357.1 lytic murein transglycosylase B [Gammaproteobacteria bacterium]